MEHELVLENSSSAPVYTLQNTIAYFKAVKYSVPDWDISIIIIIIIIIIINLYFTLVCK